MSQSALPSMSQSAAALAQTSNSLAIDSKGLSSLKMSARDNSPEAIRGVAKQFEAIFLGMMLKSMRNATPNDGPLENEQSRTFTTMLDQQLTQNLVGKGVGLAEVLVKQLTKLQGITPDQQVASHSAMAHAQANSSSADNVVSAWHKGSSTVQPEINLLFSGHMHSRSLAKLSSYTQGQQPRIDPSSWNKESTNAGAGTHVSDFAARMMPYAEKVSARTGIPAIFMVAQAALESGWGRSELRYENGAPSYNLFGIKASGNWAGRSVDAMTTEFIDGEFVKRVEKFRAYTSYAESFKDFTDLLRQNVRYAKVLRHLNDPISYSQAMGKSGYATDPDYGAKLQSVILSFLSGLKK
jgi:peptidoglycan hydrolase FlgJ